MWLGHLMARIRTIKPEFWTSPTVVNLEAFARLLFIGSWNFADDFGLLPDDPARLKLQVLPADPVDAVQLVEVLVDAGLYARVTAPSGDRLLRIVTFGDHQKIDKRSSGKWGNPDEWSTESPPIPPYPAESPKIPPEITPGMEGNGSSSHSAATGESAEGIGVEEEEIVEQVITSIARGRLVHARKTETIRNPNAWLTKVRKSIVADLELLAEVRRVCAKWPNAPTQMLANAAEGDVSPHLRNYEARAS